MKANFYTAIVSCFLLCMACTNPKAEPADSFNKCTQYACPIHPDKTSATAGACPLCSRPMLPVDTLKKNSQKKKH